MQSEEFLQRLVVSVVAVLAAVVYASGWGPGTLSRFIVAPVALVIAVLVALGIVPPVVAYGLVCLALVSVYLLREEHARRRRVASLAPRSAADVVPTVWVLCAAASALMLTPYVVFGEQRAAALMVGICALVMAAIVWRIASAPVQLAGGDIQSERMRDRAMRSRRAGITAVLAVGSIMVFISFVNAELPVVMPVQRIFHLASFVVWVALWAWETWYVHHLGRASCSASA